MTCKASVAAVSKSAATWPSTPQTDNQQSRTAQTVRKHTAKHLALQTHASVSANHDDYQHEFEHVCRVLWKVTVPT